MSGLSTADVIERVAALPPAVAASASFIGLPLSDISSGIMIVYGLLLIAWHLKTKWFGKGAAGGVE